MLYTLRSVKHRPLYATVRTYRTAMPDGVSKVRRRSSSGKLLHTKKWILPLRLFCLAFCAPMLPHSYAETPIISPWRPLRPGMELIETKIHEGFLFSTTITAVRASPHYFRPKVFRASEFGPPSNSAKNICKLSGASACINANFFDEQRRPLGAVISRGIIHKKLHRKGGTLTGVFVTTKDSFFIVHRSDFSPNNVLEAFQAGPRLISDGQSITGIKTTSAQGALSILCIDESENIILAKVALSLFTRYPSHIQEALRKAPFKCFQALNLDGGSSSQLFASGASLSAEPLPETALDSPGRDVVPVIFALIPVSSPPQAKTPELNAAK